MNSAATTSPLPLGRISGFRGLHGEVTVRVVSGHAERWVHVRRALVAGAPRQVTSARAYRDRLVLKLAGVDDASQAAALRGSEVSVLAADLPALPEGEFWAGQLLGLRVVERSGAPLGEVEDVLETGGTDLLVVRDPSGAEILVPLASGIVLEVDPSRGIAVVELPEGLRDLNGPEGDAP